jgi:uracil-DNA glycosylase
MKEPQIDLSWKEFLKEEFAQPYFTQLKYFLIEEKKKHTIFPPEPYIFNAFNLTPLDQVQVVILGQDPYHDHGQAHGLCFSVMDGVRFPKSLQNIFKELESDLGVPIPFSGNLERWAKQGVLLLNATLTVRAHQAGSHQNQGWEIFTDSVIKKLSSQHAGLIFVLWGNNARAKKGLINTESHHIIESVHPSPLSAYNGFFGSKPFSKINTILEESGKLPINW